MGVWVFKKKVDGHFHACLVAKGFTQIEGVDFDETFSPVTRFESLWLLLALAMLENWEIHQMVVKLAFLHGNLDEGIYMEQPQGYVVAGLEHLVCWLQKALYGLKQALWAWNLQFHGVLEELSFTCTYSDCYVMTACTAWLELDGRLQWLAPSNILDRQLNDILAIGSWHPAGVSRNGRGSTLWWSQSRVFHLDGKCCVNRVTATEGKIAWAKTRLGRDWGSRFTTSQPLDNHNPRGTLTHLDWVGM